MDNSANIKLTNGISKYIIPKETLGQIESKIDTDSAKQKKSEYNKYYYLTKKLEKNTIHITNKKIKDRLFELVSSESKNLIEKLELENKNLISRYIDMIKKVLNFIINAAFQVIYFDSDGVTSNSSLISHQNRHQIWSAIFQRMYHNFQARGMIK